jgi:hypothetical protein
MNPSFCTSSTLACIQAVLHLFILAFHFHYDDRKIPPEVGLDGIMGPTRTVSINSSSLHITAFTALSIESKGSRPTRGKRDMLPIL